MAAARRLWGARTERPFPKEGGGRRGKGKNAEAFPVSSREGGKERGVMKGRKSTQSGQQSDHSSVPGKERKRSKLREEWSKSRLINDGSKSEVRSGGGRTWSYQPRNQLALRALNNLSAWGGHETHRILCELTRGREFNQCTRKKGEGSLYAHKGDSSLTLRA